MSSAQDGTFSPRNLAILGGLLFFGLFLGEVVFPRQGGIFSQAEDARVDTMADVAMRIRPVVTLEDVLAKAVSITADVKKTPQQLYSGACRLVMRRGLPVRRNWVIWLPGRRVWRMVRMH